MEKGGGVVGTNHASRWIFFIKSLITVGFSPIAPHVKRSSTSHDVIKRRTLPRQPRNPSPNIPNSFLMANIKMLTHPGDREIWYPGGLWFLNMAWTVGNVWLSITGKEKRAKRAYPNQTRSNKGLSTCIEMIVNFYMCLLLSLCSRRQVIYVKTV